LVFARLVGTEPSRDPKIRSWSEKSISRVDSRLSAKLTASASIFGSRPSSAGAFFAHDPAGGK
jgi:hypothetical protein